MYGSMSYLQITASDLSDQLLKDFLDMESSQIVTMHIQSVDQNKAIKSIKHTITEPVSYTHLKYGKTNTKEYLAKKKDISYNEDEVQKSQIPSGLCG